MASGMSQIDYSWLYDKRTASSGFGGRTRQKEPGTSSSRVGSNFDCYSSGFLKVCHFYRYHSVQYPHKINSAGGAQKRYSGDWVYIRFGIIYPVLGFSPKFCFQNLVLKGNSKEIYIRLYPVFENLENFTDFMGIYPRI